MTPKEKAKELFDKMFEKCGQPLRADEDVNGTNESKQCALIAVDEIIVAVEYLDDDSEDFWFEVKQEINKL